MKTKYLTCCGDTNRYSFEFPLGTKDKEKALAKGDQVINDILNAITYTKMNYPNDSPNFLKAIDAIEKKLWRML